MSCCPTEILPVESSYKPQSDLVYIAGGGTAAAAASSTGSLKKGILFIPDIFGPHPNAYQMADTLAARGGFVVVMPDFFRGTQWTLDNFPPADGWQSPAWTNFLASLTYDQMKPRVQQGIAILRAMLETDSKSFADHDAAAPAAVIAKIGAVGFCWGGGIAMEALAEGLVDAAASPHPSHLTTDLMKRVCGPVCLLPTKDDSELLDIKEAAESTGHKVVYKYFEDMHHGFCGARGNFNDELNRTRANEAVDIMVKFFDETLA